MPRQDRRLKNSDSSPEFLFPENRGGLEKCLLIKYLSYSRGSWVTRDSMYISHSRENWIFLKRKLKGARCWYLTNTPPFFPDIETADSSDDIQINRIVGEKSIILLGKGNFGAVYGVYSQVLATYVAVKILGTDNKPSAPAAGSEGEFLYANVFRSNFGKLNSCRVLKIFSSEDYERQNRVMISERCKFGYLGNLRNIVPGNREHMVKDIILGNFGGLLLTLAELNKLGYSHNDIKPGNILLREDLSAVFADFGLFAAVKVPEDDSNTKSTAFSGTEPYAAPEAIKHGNANCDQRKCDIWSLGATFYELLTGKNMLNFPEPRENWKNSLPEDLRGTIADNDLLIGAIARMFEYDPRKRPTARELYDQLARESSGAKKAQYEQLFAVETRQERDDGTVGGEVNGLMVRMGAEALAEIENNVLMKCQQKLDNDDNVSVKLPTNELLHYDGMHDPPDCYDDSTEEDSEKSREKSGGTPKIVLRVDPDRPDSSSCKGKERPESETDQGTVIKFGNAEVQEKNVGSGSPEPKKPEENSRVEESGEEQKNMSVPEQNTVPPHKNAMKIPEMVDSASPPGSEESENSQATTCSDHEEFERTTAVLEEVSENIDSLTNNLNLI